MRPRVPILVDALAALANSTRLDILHQIRMPKVLREIEIKMISEDGRGCISRQAVRKHLDILIEAGVARTRNAERNYGATTEYILDHRAIYHIAESVRGLARLRPAVEFADATVPGPDVPSPPRVRPALVIARGLEEGLSFPLVNGSRWVIGRRRSADVSLDFDLTVSAENTLVVRERDGFFIETLPGSLNGTRINFEQLPPGGRHRLENGDVVGLGRVLLLYRE